MAYEYHLFMQRTRLTQQQSDTTHMQAVENVLAYLLENALESLESLDPGWEYTSHSLTVIGQETMLTLLARRDVPDPHGNGTRA